MNDDALKNLVKSGSVSVQAYRDAIARAGIKPQAPAESKDGKKAGAPLDIRPAAARNKPKPKHSKFQKRAGHNPPKPEHADNAEGSPAKTYPLADWQRKHLQSEAQSLEGAIRSGKASGHQAEYWRQAQQLRKESESRVPLPRSRPKE